MSILALCVTILAMFAAIVLLDYLWLGKITKNFLIKQFGSLVKVEGGSIKINLLAGIVTWLIIAIGVFIFAVNPAATLTQALLLGAAFGFITYTIYDLTNLTFIVNYPVKFIFVDIGWGTVLCLILSAIGYFVKGLFV